MKSIIIDRGDFNSQIHPYMFDEILEELIGWENLPESRSDYPDSITIRVASAKVD